MTNDRCLHGEQSQEKSRKFHVAIVANVGVTLILNDITDPRQDERVQLHCIVRKV